MLHRAQTHTHAVHVVHVITVHVVHVVTVHVVHIVTVHVVHAVHVVHVVTLLDCCLVRACFIIRTNIWILRLCYAC